MSRIDTCSDEYPNKKICILAQLCELLPMKFLLFPFALLSFSTSIFSQTKTIANQEISAGGGVYFAAVMNVSQITVTIQGPSDRWFAVAFGTAMADGDALIYTDGKVGAMHALGVWDYDLNAQNAAGVDRDTQENWTVSSNTVNGGVRTIVASRNLSTGDPIDHIINFADASLNLVWAKGNTATNTLAYHGGGNRGSASLLWTIPDLTPPQLAATPFLPADNSIDVALGTNGTITFNENIALGTGMIELHLVSGGTLVEQFNAATSPNLSVSSNQLTINPSLSLSSFTDYYITVASGAIADLAGNAYAGFTNNSTWNFTTIDISGDVTAPSLSVGPFTPADNAIDVAINTNMTVLFDEEIQLGTGLISLLRLSDDLLIESFDVATSPNLSVSITELTLNPSLNLSNLTGYYITVAPGALTDLAGNAFAGFTNNSTWNFTTIDIPSDVTPPSLGVGPFNPADNAVSVPVTTNMTVLFDEDIQLGTGLISLFRLSDNLLIESFDVATSPNLTVNGMEVTINPTSDLVVNTEYYITIDQNAIEDISGNGYAGFNNNSTWNFATPLAGIEELDNPFSIEVLPNNFISIVNHTNDEFSLQLIALSGQVLFEQSSSLPIQLINTEKFKTMTVLISVANKKDQTTTKLIRL